MKLIFKVTIILSAAVLIQADSKDEYIKESRNECVELSTIPANLLAKVRSYDFTDTDHRIKFYVFCMFRKVGYLDDQANFVQEKALANIPEALREKAKKTFAACDSNLKDTVERGWKAVTCYNEHIPNSLYFL